MAYVPRTRPTRSASKVGRASGFFAAEVTRVVDGTDVYVQVPRLTLEFEHGPVQYLGSLPTAGDSVWVSFQEGRVDELVMFTSSTLTGDVTSVTAGTNLTGTNESGPNVTLALDTNITGDITFDTSVLVVDATNNRIGIGIAAPTAMLHIVDAGNATRMDRSGYDSYGWVHSAGAGIQFYNYTDSRTEMYFNGAGNVGIGTTSPVLTGLTIGRQPSDANEGGQVNWEGGTSYSNNLSIDRHGNDLRLLYNGSQTGTWSGAGALVATAVTSSGAVRAVSGGADGGMVMGQAYSSSYVGLHTNGMGNSGNAEYVLLSDGTHTFLSSGENGDTYIRGADNATTHQLKIGSAAAEFSGYVQTGSNLRVISYNGEGWSEGIRVVVASGSWGGIRFKRTNDTSAEIGNWYMGYQNNSTHDFVFGCYNTGQLDNILYLKNSNGYVGIGTATPGALLDVNGSMKAADDTNTASYFGRTAIGADPAGGYSDYAWVGHRDQSGSGYALLQHPNGTTYLNCVTDTALNFRVSNTTHMCLNGSTGYVGIGTTSPVAKLSVTSGVTNSSAHFGRYDDEGLFLHSDAQSSHYNWRITTNTEVDTGFEIAPSTAVGGTTWADPLFVIKQSGNVGVGSHPNAPISPLNVSNLGAWTHGWSSGHQLTVTTMGGNAGIGLYSSKGSGDAYNMKYGYIRFGNPEINTYAGGIKYTHFSNDMDFRAGGSDFINMQSTGQVVTTVTNTSQTYSSIYAQASHASTTADGIIRIHSARSANSAFEFLRAGTVSDPEFILRGDGNGYADGSWTSPAADYAEYFEWNDGNPSSEDRVGITVSLIGNKIQAATEGDEIIGVVSANPVIVGDAAWNKWQNKYLVDDYNRYQTETVETVSWVETPLPSEDDEEPSKVTHSYIFDSIPEGVTPPDDAERLDVERRILNPDYDPDQTYVPREDRPEWDTIGLVGKLRIRKGQPTAAGWIKMRDISDTVEEWLVK